MDLTTATPLEIDTRLSDLYGKRHAAQEKIDGVMNTIHRLANDTKVGRWSRSEHWALLDANALEAVRLTGQGDLTYVGSNAVRALDEYAAAEGNLLAINTEIKTLNVEFHRRGGWTRAFLVQASNGHVHSSMNCSTCYPTTEFAWMVDYADHDEAQIIEAAGEKACTICYPHAPVDTLRRPTKMFGPDQILAQKYRENRAAEKAVREAKKIANGLTADGSEFEVVTDTWNTGKARVECFKTEAAASQWVVGKIHDDTAYGYSITEIERVAINQIVAAIAAKHDTTFEVAKAEIDRKVEAKRKRDAR